VSEPAAVEISLVPPEGIPVLQNLAAFYVYDLSEFMGWDCPESGLFGARGEDEWYGASFDHYLLRVGGRLAGFAIVERLSESDFDMAEFFILRKFRGQGVGRKVAESLFDRYPGRWRVRELSENTAAQAFWRRVIGAYTRGSFTESREIFSGWPEPEVVQRFDTLR
jgi:predicted acetyltransferase